MIVQARVKVQQWRKIIGIHNALVHDYLTIDSELLL
ncbi:MAG: HepT-like ribonuclease domain-containing protein [Methylobacter sp.]